MSKRFKSMVCVDLMLKKVIDGEESILLMKRKNTGFDDGKWELPGGHLEMNEDLYDAMIREVKEELLITLNRNDIELVYLMHHYHGERLNFVFKADGTYLEPRIGEEEKCDEIKWFSLDKLPVEMTDKMRKMILDSENGIFYDKL